LRCRRRTETLLDAGLPVQIEPKFAPGFRGHLHVVAGVDPFQDVLFKLVFGAAFLVLTDESGEVVGCVGKAVLTHFGVDHSLNLVGKNNGGHDPLLRRGLPESSRNARG
jgi:hypothetical protein